MISQLTSYAADLTLGSDSQKLSVRVDTGSSDLWVNTPTSEICSLTIDPCSDSGTYNANSSTSSNYVSNDFEVSYADGSGAAGDYVTDSMTIGDNTLQDFQFGIGYTSSSPDAILGIGYAANEAQVNSYGGRSYANLPQALVDANLIKSNAYSLWLDDLESSSGEILFGGVDTDKYVGSLQTLPVGQIKGEYIQFVLTISRMNLVQNGNNRSLTADLPTAAILDSGSTLSYLPNNLLGDIYSRLNVRYSKRQGSAYCECDLANQAITVDFTFTSATISVPIRELVINPEQQSSALKDDDDLVKRQSFSSGVCLFGLAPSGGSGAPNILGDTFLRSAYVVYDLANNAVSLAQTNFNSTQSSVREIGTGRDSVPDATRVANVVQATLVDGQGRIGDPTGTGGSSDNDPVSAGDNLNSRLPTFLMALGLVVGIFVL